MNRDERQRGLSNAEALCKQQGARLTSKRKRILALLIEAGRPLSAYQISDLYHKTHEHQLSIMSVYRMLNFLISQHLVHRLETTNQYLPCTHIDNNDCPDTGHGTPQFLICDKCQSVAETGVRGDILKQLSNDLKKSGFTMEQPQLEIHGTCQKCSKES